MSRRPATTSVPSPRSADEATAAGAIAAIMRRARGGLERKLVLWTLLLVLAPTLASGVWFNRITRRSILDTHQHSAAGLTQTVAASLAASLSDGWSARAASTIDSLAMDARVAFVIVTDPDGRVVHRRILRTDAREAMDEWLRHHLETPALHANRSWIVGRAAGTLILHQNAILDPPIIAWDAQTATADHRLMGFVVIGLKPDNLAATLDHLQTAQIMAGLAVALAAMPIVIWSTRRWARPLRELLRGTLKLRAGEAPEPVPTDNRDEVGQLATAFNDMAHHLWLARRELQKANADLEDKVRQRTDQLQEANRHLQTQMREKDEFLRAISHDLSAPLRNIDGLASMLVMKHAGQLADDARVKLERIHANVRAQTELISDLLELSRLRSGPVKCQRIDMGALLTQVREQLAYDIESKAILFESVGRAPLIYAEQNRIRQVLQNLVDNAIKYMHPLPPAGVHAEAAERERRVRVEFHESAEMYEVIVRDTGPGISGEDIERIFQPFRRGTRAGVHDIPGRGLGLTACRAIVERYGGRLWVESEPGKGSAFRFTLSKSAVAAEAAGAEAADAAPTERGGRPDAGVPVAA